MNENDYWCQMYANAIAAMAPSVVHGPAVFRDGDKWCALYGSDIQAGVCGFGDSPELACFAFDRAWYETLSKDASGKEPLAPRFAVTYCSQCGHEFGPGDHGYSYCGDHKGKGDQP